MYHIGCGEYCPNGIDPNDKEALTREVRLTFAREELLYDIRNLAYVEGHVMSEEQQHAQHTLIDVGEEGNIDRVTRMLGLVHAGVVEMLYPFTKSELPEESEDVNDRLEEPEEYVIELRVPKTLSRTTVDFLSKLIHEYMVYRVLCDWLSITNPDASQHWAYKAASVEEDINIIKNMRTGTLRRPASPF